MPQVDMSLDKLRAYAGRNPRPADFDEFWDRSLAELDSIDPAPFAFEPKIIPQYGMTIEIGAIV